jgi:hypothetical protein
MSAPSPEEIAEEDRRARQLRLIVDLTCSVIAQGGIGRQEAEALVGATRRRALALFPDKGETFDLVLAPRFGRLIAEFVSSAPSKVLPFRRR